MSRIARHSIVMRRKKLREALDPSSTHCVLGGDEMPQRLTRSQRQKWGNVNPDDDGSGRSVISGVAGGAYLGATMAWEGGESIVMDGLGRGLVDGRRVEHQAAKKRANGEMAILTGGKRLQETYWGTMRVLKLPACSTPMLGARCSHLVSKLSRIEVNWHLQLPRRP